MQARKMRSFSISVWLLGLLQVCRIRVLVSASDTCQQGWVDIAGACFLFQNKIPLTWAEASGDCASYAATLLRFRSGDEVAAFSAATRDIPGDSWWTDLIQTGHPGIWTWGQDEEVFNDQLTWTQEPDDSKHLQNCVTMNANGRLGDDLCDQQYGFICERPRTGASVNCSTWLDLMPTSCYSINQAQATWSDATVTCGSQNATLLSLDSLAELTAVAAVLSGMVSTVTDNRWWTALNDIHVEGIFVKADSTPVDGTVQLWDHAPNNLSASEQCALTDSRGMFTPARCQRRNKYACRLDESADQVSLAQQLGCPGLWMRGGNKCYLFRTNGTLTRQSARAFCQQHGGDLLKVESLAEKWWLTLQSEKLKTNNLWTGLSRTAPNQNSWAWADGATANMAFVEWNHEPNDYDGSEDCAVMAQDAVFNDNSCYSRAGYICEQTANVMPCPENFRMSGDMGACYFVSKPTDSALVNWWEARSICKNLTNNNGYLLAPTSQDEMQFVSQLLLELPPTAASWWTDFNDMAVEGLWQFSSLQEGPADSTMIVWAGEPNDANGQEDCAVMYFGGRYNDVNCNATSNVACEKPIVATRTGAADSIQGSGTPAWLSIAAAVLVSILL